MRRPMCPWFLVSTAAHLVFATMLLISVTFIAVPATAQTLTVLYTFQGGTNGALAANGVIRDASGNLYGTTAYGGDVSCNSSFPPQGCGTVYKLDSANTLAILHPFSGVPDGQQPSSQLLLTGNLLFGATSSGGEIASCLFGGTGCGTVFAVSLTGKEVTRYAFRGGSDASLPLGNVIPIGKRFFGTGFYGGTQSLGAVYEVEFGPGGARKEKVLHSFVGGTGDGSNANNGLVSQSGTLFGTTTYGGIDNCTGGFNPGCGTVYKITPGGESLVHAFNGTDGYGPILLISDKKGGFYGLANSGGSFNNGTVFQMTTGGTVTTLYSFAGGNDGYSPGGLVLDSSGNLFGTTYVGGPANAGTIFELSPNGQGGWTKTTLYSFTNGADGNGPQPGIVLDEQNRKIYGAALEGGDLSCFAPYGCGTVFVLSY